MSSTSNGSFRAKSARIRTHRAAAGPRVGLSTEPVLRKRPHLNNLHNGINLAQGFPAFDPPAELIEAAVRALNDGYHQYAITWGSPRLRAAGAGEVGAAHGGGGGPGG